MHFIGMKQECKLNIRKFRNSFLSCGINYRLKRAHICKDTLIYTSIQLEIISQHRVCVYIHVNLFLFCR